MNYEVCRIIFGVNNHILLLHIEKLYYASIVERAPILLEILFVSSSNEGFSFGDLL